MRRLIMASVVLALALGPGGTLATEEESPAGTFGPEQLEELTAKSELATTLWEQGDLDRGRGGSASEVPASLREPK